MSKLIREANAQRQGMIPQTPLSQTSELPVTSQRVDIPRQSINEMPKSNPEQVDFNPPDEENFDLQKQVDELAAQIAANDVDQA